MGWSPGGLFMLPCSDHLKSTYIYPRLGALFIYFFFSFQIYELPPTFCFVLTFCFLSRLNWGSIVFSLLNVAVQSNFMLHKESSFALTKTSNQRDHKPQRDEVTAETNKWNKMESGDIMDPLMTRNFLPLSISNEDWQMFSITLYEKQLWKKLSWVNKCCRSQWLPLSAPS